MTTAKKIEQLNKILSYACMGASCYFKHPLFKFNYTDNVKEIADIAGAYWLIDAIGSYLIPTFKQKNPFQKWELNVNEDNSATLVCTDGNGNVLVQQNTEYTDFPLKKIEFFFQNNVLYLVQEH